MHISNSDPYIALAISPNHTPTYPNAIVQTMSMGKGENPVKTNG